MRLIDREEADEGEDVLIEVSEAERFAAMPRQLWIDLYRFAFASCGTTPHASRALLLSPQIDDPARACTVYRVRVSPRPRPESPHVGEQRWRDERDPVRRGRTRSIELE